MLNQNFVILGVIITLLGALSYIIDTLKGKVQPNRVSWGLWAFASFIAFAAELKQGVGMQSLFTFVVGFSPLLIFIASFVNKKSYWKLGKFDFFCAVLSLTGLLLWYLTKVGNIAIIFSIFADLAAGTPTLVKAFRFPETENWIEFSSSFIASILTMLTLKTWGFAYSAYPLYILLFDATAILFIKFKVGKIFLQRTTSKS